MGGRVGGGFMVQPTRSTGALAVAVTPGLKPGMIDTAVPLGLTDECRFQDTGCQQRSLYWNRTVPGLHERLDRADLIAEVGEGVVELLVELGRHRCGPSL